MATKKLTKRRALLLLKDYFYYSERSRKIGAMEIETELTYDEKVEITNRCHRIILDISDELSIADLDLITLR